MNSIKSSLSKLSAAAVVLGLVACSHNQQQAAATPPPPPQQQPTSEQYGSAMGQPGAAEMGQPTPGTEPGAPPGAQPGMTPEQQGAYGQAPGATGAPSGAGGAAGAGQMGGQEQMGGQGQMGQGEMGQPGQTGVESGQAGVGAPGSMDMSSLNDNQIAGVLQAINQGNIQESLVAETKARSPEVKRFARQMTNTHRQVQNRETALFTRAQITPSESTVSQQLRQDSQTHLADLQTLRGTDFDRMYMDDQVRWGNRALELLDRALPNIKNPELKADVQNLRGRVANQLSDAERIQQTLQRGSTNKQGGSGSQTPSSPSQGNPSQNQ